MKKNGKSVECIGRFLLPILIIFTFLISATYMYADFGINSSLSVAAQEAQNRAAVGWTSLGSEPIEVGEFGDDVKMGSPTSTTHDGNIYVVWEHNFGSNNRHIYLRYWDGSEWRELGGSATGNGLSNGSGVAFEPAITVAENGHIYVTWHELANEINEVFLVRWNGSVWEGLSGSDSGFGLSNDRAGGSLGPSIVLGLDGNPIVTWQQWRNGVPNINVRRWNGGSWEELGNSARDLGISGTAVRSGSPSIDINENGTIYVAWREEETADWEIYLRYWNGNSWLALGDSASTGGVSDNDGMSSLPELKISNSGTPFIVWQDNSSGTFQIYLRFWNGTFWSTLSGSASSGGISSTNGDSRRPHLAFDSQNRTYVSWEDGSQIPSEIYVRVLMNNVWTQVGDGSATGLGVSDSGNVSLVGTINVRANGRLLLIWNEFDADNNQEGILARQKRIISPESPIINTIQNSDGNGNFTISWNSVFDINNYQLEERKDNGSWNRIYDGQSLSFVVTNRADGNWDYRLRATNQFGNSEWSAIKSTTVGSVSIAAPTITIIDTGSSQDREFQVSWGAVSGAQSYELQEKYDSGSWTLRYTGAGLSYLATNRSNGVWEYRIRAVGNNGESEWSAVRAITVNSNVPSDHLLFLPAVLNDLKTYFEGPDEMEPNNNPQMANGPLRENRIYNGSFPVGNNVERSDYFYIDIDQPTNVRVTLTNLNNSGRDYDLVLRNANLTNIGFSGNPLGIDEIITTAIPLVTGRYFIQVTNGNPSGSSHSYHLDWTTIP